MGVYIPLKVRLAKASIPQVVAYIQTYLEDNPIPAIDTFAELIAEFLADHPELVAVASVNAKTGAVILTGADIMLNSDADVTLATEITNLNTMIASLSSQVAQAVATVGGFETDIEDINSDIDTINVALDTKDTEIYQINQTLTSHLNGINANNTKNAQQDTRLTALEADVSTLETYNTATQGALSLHSEQIAALQGMIGDSSEILERLGEVEQTAENAQSAVTAMQTSVSTLQTNVQTNTTDISTIQNENTIKAGDTFTLSQRIAAGGFITGSSRFVWFTIFTGKKITATNATVTACSATMRGINGYLEANQPTDLLGTGYTIEALISNADCGIITFRINKTSALTNAENNTPIAFEVFTLTVNFS